MTRHADDEFEAITGKLPRYRCGGWHRCPVCESPYPPTIHYCRSKLHGHSVEHFHRTCPTCGYVRLEAIRLD